MYGIAIASAVGHGFISKGRPNNVTIFDLKTLNVLRQVATGSNTYGRRTPIDTHVQEM
jgi:hypothetical protein